MVFVLNVLEILEKVALGAAGASFSVALLARILPNEKVHAVAKKAGETVTKYGRSRWGRAFYEPIENFVQNSLGVFLAGFSEGLDFDDLTEDEKEKQGETK